MSEGGPTSPEHEAHRVAAALEGDAQAFAALMKRYHGPLRRLLRGIVRNTEDAEDLVQETFLRAYRFLHRFEQGRPFGPWLMQIGVNLARNHLRRDRREVALDVRRGGRADAGDAGDGDAHDGAWLADWETVARQERSALLRAVRRALAELAPEQRVVLELRLLAQLSYREIAATLAIPIGTVMSRLNRGRRQLQAALEGERSRPNDGDV